MVEPIVTVLFDNLSLVIEPANLLFVIAEAATIFVDTVPVSPVEISVPEFADNVNVPPATEFACKVVVPLVAPDNKIFLPLERAIFSELVHAPVELIQLNVLSVVPLIVIPPPLAEVLDAPPIAPSNTPTT